jgi:hypothetical protein
MPSELKHFREQLVGTIKMSGGQGMIQKKINLKHGFRHALEYAQCFNEGIMQGIGGVEADRATMLQIMITPFPVQPTDMDVVFSGGPDGEFPTSLPLSGDRNVLFKQTNITAMEGIDFYGANNTKVWTQTMPNQTAAFEQNRWYSNTLYLTAFVCTTERSFQTPYKINLGFYLRVVEDKCNAVEYGMGQHREFLDAQIRNLSITALKINPDIGNMGRTFPSWKFGGIRPEIMLSSANALIYYNKVASNADQTMGTIAEYRSRFKNSSKMTAFDEAFGDSSLNLPAWIDIMDVGGITSGLIRPTSPPARFGGNGNTLMFDTNGVIG